MLRKRDVSDIEGTASPRTGAVGSEGRMSATPIGTGSAGRTATAPERSMGPATIVPQRSEGAPPVREKLRDVGEAVGERAGAAKERVAEGVGRAGQAVREAVRQVDIEEFNLKGSVGGYPFNVELEDEGEGKFLAFEVNLETENGDVVRISGRKRLGERSVSGEVGSGPSEFRGTDRTEVLGELETRPSDL